MATPTIQTVEQTYQGETIQCAKIESSVSSLYKFPGIVNAEGDYEFQGVICSDENSRIGIKVGDADVRFIDTYISFSRYVLPFKQITINESDSLYLYLPPGVFYFYNLQLERGNVATQWQPAPEDAAEYSDEAAEKAVNSQTQLDVFNKLTNNGQSQGLYMLNGELYVNAEFIKAGVLSGIEINNGNGTFRVDADGNVTANSLSSNNAEITGGTINIRTQSETSDVIWLTYRTWDMLLRPQSLYLKYTAYNNRTYSMAVSAMNIQCRQDVDKYGFDLSAPTGTTASSTAGLSLYDGAGTSRVTLTQNGLQFYNASGTRTAWYKADGTIA